MKQKSLKVTFYIKADKVNKRGEIPVYGKIVYLDTVATFSTGEYITLESWEKFKVDARSVNSLNKTLVQIENSIETIQAQFVTNNQVCSAIRLRDTLKKNSTSSAQPIEPPKIMISQVISELLQRKEKLIARGKRSPDTMTKYNTVKFYFFCFLSEEHKLKDIALVDLKYTLISDFYLYLTRDKVINGIEYKKISNNVAQKYIQNFRGYVNYAIKLGHLQSDPFLQYEYEWDEKETVYLTKHELELIENKHFSNERLEIVKSIFLFSCYTGYAPVDLLKITRDNIELRNDGEKWFNMSRTKTGIKSDVMVFPKTQALIDKYKNHPDCVNNNRLLPIRSNQKMNEYLKEIATLCGITKNLHHYVARHTFATTIMLGNGASLEVTKEAMGHKRITQTEHYGKLNDERKSKEMKKVKRKV